MRDPRFIAVHRGGLLSLRRHRMLARWAADCAAKVLSLFQARSTDKRPQRAIEQARAWARGDIATGDAMKAAVAAHAAARRVRHPPAIAAARAAGHAAATAHMAEHALGTVVYGHKAAIAAGKSASTLRDWQMRHLPKCLHRIVASALDAPRFRSAIK